MRAHLHLFDTSTSLHSNKFAVENAWIEIAVTKGKSVEVVKKDWKNVRDKFGRGHKKWKVACKSGAGQINFGYPKILTGLSWLTEHIKHRTSESNLAVCLQLVMCVFCVFCACVVGINIFPKMTF